jgi:ADP-ribosylglycohydrolase
MQNYNKSLIALACGDSYGSHYEMEGLMGCRYSISSLPNKPLFPNITDDTKMATILLKHYQKYKTIKKEILLNEYKYWAKTEGNKDGIGVHTREVLLTGKTDKNSQGNGALMRVIPFGVALIEDGYSFKEAVDLMYIDSSLTHENETIYITNAISLDLAINGLKVLEKKEYKPLIERLQEGSDAWVINTLDIVIKALKSKRKFLTAFKYIVSKGGDTDTNCAIFGAIYGYRNDISDELDVKEFINLDCCYF